MPPPEGPPQDMQPGREPAPQDGQPHDVPPREASPWPPLPPAQQWQMRLHGQPHAGQPSQAGQGAPAVPGSEANPPTPLAQAAAQAAAQAKAADAAAPAAPAAPTGPTADPMEIAALELMLAEPANQEMIRQFGGELKPLPTWTSVGQGIEARYGQDLGARLYQLQNAQRAVEEAYFDAMDQALHNAPPGPPQALRLGQPEPSSGVPGWQYKPGNRDTETSPR